MILTTALDNGYVFISLLAILTSVISAVYYLIIVKNIFTSESIYNIIENNKLSISSSITIPISVLSLLLLSFMFYNIESSLNVLIQLD
jgi:NADH-ubiquinone oxidoreductase chain 2